MVNHAQDLMSVKIFFVLPNKLIPTEYHPMFFVQLLASANEPIKHGMGLLPLISPVAATKIQTIKDFVEN